MITKDPPGNNIEEVFPIAGELREKGGKDLNAKWERLKNSHSNADSEKEGLLVEMNGGFKTENNKKKPQKAIIEFLCDKTRTGLENLPDPQDRYTEAVLRREDGEGAGNDTTPSLEFLKYKEEEEIDVLRLRWRTSHACESSKEEEEKKKGERWGFFTWFIIMYELVLFITGVVC